MRDILITEFPNQSFLFAHNRYTFTSIKKKNIPLIEKRLFKITEKLVNMSNARIARQWQRYKVVPADVRHKFFQDRYILLEELFDESLTGTNYVEFKTFSVQNVSVSRNFNLKFISPFLGLVISIIFIFIHSSFSYTRREIKKRLDNL